ncbi:hypothetical protein [Streptomyces sp. NPDC088847]|uniref:hypothetical protein n=1 Tax=Streptomyces sp. NPDC088847 TaxID=3365909 RepID=UPI00380049EB
MSARDWLRSLKPGDDQALAKDLRAQAQRHRSSSVSAISEHDSQRTPAEVEESKARGRRSKRSQFEPPAPGINP